MIWMHDLPSPSPRWLDRLRANDQRRGSKHANGKQKPRGWHQKLRRERKARKLARRAQRGK